nr:hypothetical protein [Tanacetum cinerariifolium]
MKVELSPSLESGNKLGDSSYTFPTCYSSFSSSFSKAEYELEVVMLPFLEEFPIDFTKDDDLDVLPTLAKAYAVRKEAKQQRELEAWNSENDDRFCGEENETKKGYDS